MLIVRPDKHVFHFEDVKYLVKDVSVDRMRVRKFLVSWFEEHTKLKVTSIKDDADGIVIVEIEDAMVSEPPSLELLKMHFNRASVTHEGHVLLQGHDSRAHRRMLLATDEEANTLLADVIVDVCRAATSEAEGEAREVWKDITSTIDDMIDAMAETSERFANALDRTFDRFDRWADRTSDRVGKVIGVLFGERPDRSDKDKRRRMERPRRK